MGGATLGEARAGLTLNAGSPGTIPFPKGDVPKWLRGGTANPLRIGSNPIVASKFLYFLAWGKLI